MGQSRNLFVKLPLRYKSMRLNDRRRQDADRSPQTPDRRPQTAGLTPQTSYRSSKNAALSPQNADCRPQTIDFRLQNWTERDPNVPSQRPNNGSLISFDSSPNSFLINYPFNLLSLNCKGRIYREWCLEFHRQYHKITVNRFDFMKRLH